MMVKVIPTSRNLTNSDPNAIMEVGHAHLTVALAFMAIVISGVRHPMDLIFREVDALNRKLSESEAFNASVFDSVIESIAVLDANGAIVAVNAPWRRFAQENGAQDQCRELKPCKRVWGAV